MKSMRWMGGGLLVVLLAACGKQDAEPVAAIPVLVVHPGTVAGQEAAAYPGEVHARQESQLSFRVGGNMVKRLVDAGQRVRKASCWPNWTRPTTAPRPPPRRPSWPPPMPTWCAPATTRSATPSWPKTSW